MTTRRDRCETCRFWELPHPDDPGMCHRFPQSVEKRPLDWCGEWQQNAEAIAAALRYEPPSWMISSAAEAV